MAAVVDRTSAMRHPWRLADGRAACAGTPTTPGTEGQGLCAGRRHLGSADLEERPSSCHVLPAPPGRGGAGGGRGGRQGPAMGPSAGAPPAKKGGKGKLIIVAVVLLLAGGGGAAWWFGLLSHGAPAEAKEEGEAKEKRPEVGALLALDPFIANLADEDGKRYLKATVQIEFLEGRVPADVNARLP